jgi:hypothetical protein
MHIKLSTKLNLLTKNSTILIVGELNKRLSSIVEQHFKHKEHINFTEQSMEILNASFVAKFDITLFILNKNNFEILKEIDIIKSHNIIYLIDDNIYESFRPYINHSFATIVSPVDDDIILEKFYTLLATYEVNNLLKTKEKIVNKYKDETINDDIEPFLDTHSGNIMFINDDLNEQLQKLQNLEISKEIFSNISISLLKLHNILKQNSNLIHLSNLFLEFSQFLDSLDFENIQPEKFSAFDYLTTIIEDITIYIDELFVYKIFKDVKLFEDSMASNMEYFEAKLLGNDNTNDDNLEFF